MIDQLATQPNTATVIHVQKTQRGAARRGQSHNTSTLNNEVFAP